jgi:hypothetical protein
MLEKSYLMIVNNFLSLACIADFFFSLRKFLNPFLCEKKKKVSVLNM